jgi:hypothetical protein
VTSAPSPGLYGLGAIMFVAMSWDARNASVESSDKSGRHFQDKSSLVYCAFTQSFDPVSLTATSEKKIRAGLPSAVPRWSIEISRGPAFL